MNTNRICGFHLEVFQRLQIPGTFQELYQLCLPALCTKLQNYYKALLNGTAGYRSQLCQLDVLSVTIETQTQQALLSASLDPTARHQAEVYTRESWIHVLYNSGQLMEQSVINCYKVEWMQGTRRISGNEVFILAN